MTPTEVLASFRAAQEIFVTIAGKPSDEDIIRIREVLTPLLLSIPYDESHDDNNLWGIIASKDDYGDRYNQAVFTVPARPPIYPVVSSDATAPVRAEAEFKNAAKLVDFNVHAAAERGCHEFIKSIVEDTWIAELKHAATFYVGVKASALLAHLQKHCGGLHALDVVDLQVEMRLYYADAAGIPEYIIMLEDSQKKAKRANLPISDDVLAAIATKSLMEANTFPDETKDWGKLPLNQKSWAEWKAHYLLAHEARELHIRACGGKEPFNGANAASEIPPTANRPVSSDRSAVPPSEAAMERLDDYLDNIANAATNEKAVLEELVATNSKQAETISTQAQNIKSLTHQVQKLHEQISSLKKGSGKNSSTWTPVSDGYCWSHGYRCAPGHSSLTCRHQLPGHKKEATRRNIMGGSTANKGWEA
jgi:hypothetical protein